MSSSPNTATATARLSNGTRTIGVLEFLLGLLVFFSGLAAATFPPTRLFSYAIAVTLFGLAGYLLYDALFVRLTGPQARRPRRRERRQTPTPAHRAATPNAIRIAAPAKSVGAAWRAHREELSRLPVEQRRPQVLAVWQQTLRAGAGGYAERVDQHPQAKQLTRAEQDTALTAYRCGYMVGRNWLEPRLVQAQLPRLGRALRDELHRLGLDFTGLSPATGVVLDEALRRVCEEGDQDGRSNS